MRQARKSARRGLAVHGVLVLVALGACGGGGEPEPDTVRAVPAAHNAPRASLVSNTTLTSTQLFDWAEAQFPSLFPGHKTSITTSSYAYRYYPETQSYLGVADGKVYGLGAFTSNQLAVLGVLADLTCTVLPTTCVAVVLDGPSAVTVNTTGAQTVGGNSFASSSKLVVAWTAPAYTVDHYVITATEALKSTSVSATSTTVTATLTTLKAATAYSVVVKACKDAACTQAGSATAVSGTTSQEYWQMQGTSGATADAVARVTSDSNTLNYALVYGDWAEASLRGKIRYYYNPSADAEKGLKTALSQSVASATASSVTSFDTLTGYGLVRGSTAVTQSSGLGASIGQAIAIPYNGKVRLMFEAEGIDKKNRIYQLDSVDGYVGVDFNPGSATVCNIESGHMVNGGACAPSIALGLSGDGFASTGVSAFRQMKLLYPTQTSWVWDGSAKTPMIVTMDLNSATASSCGAKYKFTQGWALWDGTKWALQYNTAGTCPKLFDGMQAPAPIHLGDGRYKLYFSNNVTPTTQQTFDFNNKPVKLMYGTAAAGLITFEDFETMEQAREVNFLWPDGSLMALFTTASAGAETKLDDYTVFAPTGSLDTQVMYANFSGGSKGPFTATAILLNP